MNYIFSLATLCWWLRLTTYKPWRMLWLRRIVELQRQFFLLCHCHHIHCTLFSSFSLIRPLASSSIARGYALCSAHFTRSCSVSTVSLFSTGTASCVTIAPASTSSYKIQKQNATKLLRYDSIANRHFKTQTFLATVLKLIMEPYEASIGRSHDGVILLLRPESFSFFLSYSNLVIPARFE